MQRLPEGTVDWGGEGVIVGLSGPAVKSNPGKLLGESLEKGLTYEEGEGGIKLFGEGQLLRLRDARKPRIKKDLRCLRGKKEEKWGESWSRPWTKGGGRFRPK